MMLLILNISALAHDNEHMGRRYIEIKEAKHTEMEWVVNKMTDGGGGGPDNMDNIVRLRGLPYGCTKQDIDAFFSGKVVFYVNFYTMLSKFMVDNISFIVRMCKGI